MSVVMRESNIKIKVIAGILFASFLLTACGQAKMPAEPDVTSLQISEDGKVTSYLVDTLDKDYYDVDELTDMVVSEVAEYNTNNQTGENAPVSWEKVETYEESDKVLVVMNYDSVEAYEKYNGNELYFGMTDGEKLLASSQSYILNLVSVKDGTVMSKEQREKKWDNKHVIIADVKAVIYCPYQVTYVSEGVKILPDGGVDTSQTEGSVMILMKK